MYYYDAPEDKGSFYYIGAYGYNATGVSLNLLTGLGATVDFQPVGEAMVVNPAEMLAFGDAVFGVFTNEFGDSVSVGVPDLGEGRWDDSPTRVSAASKGLRRVIRRRHFDRWMCVFADGHAEGPKTDELFSRTNPELLRWWSRDNLAHLELFR